MNKVYDAIMGLAVGDALGVPVEFRKRDTFAVTDMIGYGTHNQPAGTWSDDSSMTLATLESIGRLGKIDPADIMHNFSKWLNEGKFTPYGEVFDVGCTTAKAIRKYNKGVSPGACGCGERSDNGNGALMRILPLGLIFGRGSSYTDIFHVASLTHAHCISNASCGIYCMAAGMLFAGESKGDIFERILELRGLLPSEFDRLFILGNLTRDEIKSSGYVIDTLEAALWCFLHTDTYAECVLTAVNLGEDTDTVAAVAGGLAGIFYGEGGRKGIPVKWILQIARKDWIETLCAQFENQWF